MASGLAVRAKIRSALRKLSATSRPVYFRTRTVTGGNQLLGIGSTVTVSDALVDPQPAVELLSAEQIAASGGLYQAGDYGLVFDGSIAESTFQTKQLVYGSDVLAIVRYEPAVINGTVVAWTITARSVKP
jgi:hypothetical protein